MASVDHHHLVEYPTPPRAKLPAGACDAHAHVFGPHDRFPLSPDAGFAPPSAPAAMHRAMLDRLGLGRGVLVQGSCYGTDNRCLLDAIAQAPDRLRGIGAAAPSISDEALAGLRAGGIMGLRFTEIVTARYGGRKKGAIGFDDLMRLGPRLRDHGMMASIDTTAETLMEWGPRLFGLGIPLVLDHVGRIGDGLVRHVDDPAFRFLLEQVAEGRLWVKLGLVRSSRQAPLYEDFRPLHDALLRASPDHLLWGTDWPLILMGERATPDLGHLLDLLAEWTPADIHTRILVDNPARLYGFND